MLSRDIKKRPAAEKAWEEWMAKARSGEMTYPEAAAKALMDWDKLR